LRTVIRDPSHSADLINGRVVRSAHERTDDISHDRSRTAARLPGPQARAWSKDWSDPHAREEALRIAMEEPPAGVSPEEAVLAVRDVLASVGDTCPGC
jgi:hypothetical protein